MNQFLTASDSSFGNLEFRATGKCIRFRQQPMPPGCEPAYADVGFEVDSITGSTFLHVQKCSAYQGRSDEIATWLQTGSKIFPSFSALVEWVRGPMSEAFQSPATARTRERPSSTTDSLTDLSQVREQIRKDEAPAYIDEAALATRLLARVKGQDAAVKTLAASIARHSARLEPRRPAVLFAVGPTGVGKTRTAEVLAEELSAFTVESKAYHYLRLDMSEYQEAHRVSQLIGSPQGYLGHGEGSQFIDTLTANPRCIVLFDEIEKAHPAILRVLMNAMDAGRISSASKTAAGHEIDCRHAIFIFTSNLDARAILSDLEIRKGFGKRAVEDEICRRRLQSTGIAPEIVGRIGRFLVYRPLSAETRAGIMAGTVAEVASEYGIKVTYVVPSVIVDLMKSSGGGQFGMRPAQFLIDELLGAAFTEAAKRGWKVCRVVGHPFRCIPDSPANPAPLSSTKQAIPPSDPFNLVFPQNPSLN